MAAVFPASITSLEFTACRPLILSAHLADRRQLVHCLRAMGCQDVQDTGSVREAWRVLDQDQANLVILDWCGKLDAISFIKALRLPDSRQRFLPVIIIGEDCSPTLVGTVRDCGGNEFMARPWTPDIVASRVRAVLNRPRMFVKGGNFFGPDRRRRRVDLDGPDRRSHENWRNADRRQANGGCYQGQERRQGDPGFQPLERRAADRENPV